MVEREQAIVDGVAEVALIDFTTAGHLRGRLAFGLALRPMTQPSTSST